MMSAFVIVERLVFCPGIDVSPQSAYAKANKLLKAFKYFCYLRFDSAHLNVELLMHIADDLSLQGGQLLFV